MILDLLEMHKAYNRTEPSLPLRIVLQSVSQSCVQCLQWRVTHDGCGSVAVYRCGPAVVTMMTTPAPLFIISIIRPGPARDSCAVSGVPVTIAITSVGAGRRTE